MRDRPQGEVGAQPDRKPAAALGDFSVSPIFRDSQYSNLREVWRRTGDSNSETTCGVVDVLKPERTIGHHWQQSQAPALRRLFSDFARLRPLLADSSGTVNSRRLGPRPGPRPREATFGCPPPAKSSVHTSLVEPHLLHAARAVYGLVRNQVLHIRPDRVVVQPPPQHGRSEEHTSELQSPCNLVCRL